MASNGYYWYYRLNIASDNSIHTSQQIYDFAALLHAINPGINLGVLKNEVDANPFDTYIEKGEYKIMRTQKIDNKTTLPK